MPDPAGLPPKQPDLVERLLTYCLTIIVRAIPFFGIIVIAYVWQTALVWSIILSIFFDRLNDRE